MKIKNLLLYGFMISGFTALMYEVVWTRPLQLIFGSTIYAVSTMLTTFFIGFALGSYLFRNYADNVKNPVKLFAFIQIGIGLYGLIILSLFEILPEIYLSLTEFPGFRFLQFFLVFLVLIIPTTLFGGTWPVIHNAYTDLGGLGKNSAKLYSSNSFGSFLGSIGAGFLLLPLLGIMKTSIFVASLNLVLGTIILIYSWKETSLKRGRYGGENGA